MQEIENVLKEFNHFKDTEFRSIYKLSDTTMEITFVIQDDDGEDIKKVIFELGGVTESRLIGNANLSLIDMMDGVSIIKYDKIIAFALGKRNDDLLAVKNTPVYVIASEITCRQENI